MAAEPRHLLREAAERGDIDSIDSLLREQMGILDATCGRTAWTALHAAADRGRLESLRHLLGMRADPNLRTASGATALSLASRSGHLDCVMEAGLKLHDYAALVPVVEGAGGVMSDWQGNPLDAESDGTVIALGDPARIEDVLAAMGSSEFATMQLCFGETFGTYRGFGYAE